MNIGDIYDEYFLKDFQEQLPQIKEQIINYLSNQHDSVSISREVDIMDEILERDADPNYVPKFIEVTENGIKLQIINDELINLIGQYLPKDVKNLNLPLEVFKKNNNCLHNLKELETISSSYGRISGDDFKSLIDGTTISNVNFEDVEITEFQQLGVKDYKSIDMKNEFKYGDVSVTSSDTGIESGIHLSTPITEDGLSLITPDLNNGFSKNIFIDDKKVIEINRGKVVIVLSDNIQETISLIQMLSARIGQYPTEIDIKVQNKTYPGFEALKQLEEKSDVTISYGHIESATIDQFEAMRATLDYYKMLILQNDLSPAERICYAYDLIKSNIYRECNENRSSARQIHSIVDTGNIVCVGYAAFLAQLLKELGIKAHAISTQVPHKDGSSGGHERNLVEINDEKYGIQGTYAFDCTWDSNANIQVVERNGEEKIVVDVKETDKVLHKLDPMSMYNYFFIPSSEYNLYFPGEEFHNKIGDWQRKEYDPNEAAYQEIPEYSELSNDTANYDTTEEIPEDKIIEIIYNTRTCEGYSDEINQQLLQEIEMVRNIRGPKELRAEAGMRL